MEEEGERGTEPFRRVDGQSGGEARCPPGSTPLVPLPAPLDVVLVRIRQSHVPPLEIPTNPPSQDIDAKELDDQLDLASLTLSSTPDNARDDLALSTSVLPHAEVPLSDLVSLPTFSFFLSFFISDGPPRVQLATLPPLLSYTPVRVPVSTSTGSSETVTLLRRDLFDARFQILNQDESAPAVYDKGKQREAPTSDEREEAQFIDESSDLVKGVYEGGLKTWECSLDLVDCLAQRGYHPDHVGDDKVRGTSILEVGCGTAVPTCALFSRLLNEIERAPTPRGEQPKKRTRIHLQDYNDQG